CTRRPPGSVASNAISTSAVSSGTSHRSTEKALADGPEMKRAGRSAYRTAAVTIAAVGQTGDSPSESVAAASRRRPSMPRGYSRGGMSSVGQAARAPDPFDPEIGKRRGRKAEQHVDDVVVCRVDHRRRFQERVDQCHAEYRPAPGGTSCECAGEEQDDE